MPISFFPASFWGPEPFETGVPYGSEKLVLEGL